MPGKVEVHYVEAGRLPAPHQWAIARDEAGVLLFVDESQRGSYRLAPEVRAGLELLRQRSASSDT